jgi:hypothetical protein
VLGNLGPIYLELNNEGGMKPSALHYTGRTRIRINYVI